MKTFGDRERVLVNGEPGTVVDSPAPDCYRVELDTGKTVTRIGAALESLREENKPSDARRSAEDRLTHVTMERHPNDRWSIVLREGVLGPTLFEAYNVESLDACLEQLSQWRKGVIVI